jgi:hypothetical protein
MSHKGLQALPANAAKLDHKALHVVRGHGGLVRCVMR